MSLRCTLVNGAFLLFAQLAQAASATTGAEGDPALVEPLGSSRYEILHETYQKSNWEIFVRKVDGSNPRNLTRTPDIHELYPQASRDGARICFVADEKLDGKKVRSVYYMNRDGTGRTLVARNARQPCWSSDSKTIAYLKGEFSRFTVTDYATKELMFYDVATGRRRAHPNTKLHHLYNICWSADRRWIVATVHGGMGYGHAILAIEVDGQGVYDLKIGGCRPDISPDGKKLVWGKDDHTVAVADLDLESSPPRVRNIREIVKDKQHVYHMDWSPDGNYISYSHGPGGRVLPDGPGTNKGLAEFVGVRAKWDLYIVPASGKGDRVRITQNGESNKESEWLAPLRSGKVDP